MSERQLFFALHDVTPFHQERLELAEALFARWGIRKALYLLVPNYHGAFPVERDAAFQQWCQAKRPFELRWFLHGYFHHVTEPEATVDELQADGAARVTLGQPVGSPSADEGEFARLNQPLAIVDRLTCGSEAFSRCLGFRPDGFVAPKWMGTRELLQVLGEFPITWTESDHAVYHLPTGRVLRSPVITWATRSLWRKQTSLWGTPVLERLWRRTSLLRIAVHPFDFDHPAIVDCIARIVERSLEGRRQALYDDLLHGDGLRAAA